MTKGFRRSAALCLTIIGIALLSTWDWTARNSERAPRIGGAAVQQLKSAADAPYDEPGAAMEHYWRKRSGPTADHDPIAAYRTAREHVKRMPRYSTRLGSHLQDPPGSRRASVRKRTTAPALATWDFLGPGNIGGRTRTLAINPDDPQIMYAGGVSGGVLKTLDGGDSWEPVADELANIAVNSMAMHPEDPDILYVGTGEGYFREVIRGTWLPLQGAGIYRTTDGAATWSRLTSTTGEDFYWVNDMIFSPRDPERIYAATRTGVHISEDAGGTWTRVLDPDVNGGCLDLALRTDMAVDWVYAACGTFAQATVYRRIMTASGEWEAVLSERGMGRTTLAIAPSDQSVIYALAASNLPGPDGLFEQALHAVYRSQSGGSAGSWRVRVANTDSEKLNTLLLTNPMGASYVECDWGTQNSWIPMGWYCNVIAVDPTDPDVVWAAGVDLFRSDNGGRDWGLASYWWADPTTRSFVHADQHTIVFHPAYDGQTNTSMFTGSDGGVFRTDNPRASVATNEDGICNPVASSVDFTSLNHNFGITQFYHGAPFPDGDRYLGGAQDNGTLRGNDAGGPDTWSHIAGGDGGYVAVNPEDPRTIYAESQWFGFLKSTNNGTDFFDAVDGVTESRYNFLFITPFTMDPSNPQRLWVGGYRIWRTNNGAESWTAASQMTLGTGGSVSALAVDPNNSQTVLIGTTEGAVHRTDAALEADGNTIWDWSRPRQGFVTSIAFDPSTPGMVYATFAEFGGQHVWRSTDYGVTWESIDGQGSSNVPDIPVHCIVVDPGDPKRLYLGTDLGVFTSTNGGRTWAVENTGYANVVTEWLALGSDEDGTPLLFAFTHGRGAWKVELRQVPGPPLRPTERRGL